MSSGGPRKGVGGGGGAMLIKSVSLFLASGRRASSNAAAHATLARHDQEESNKNKKKTRKMQGDESSKGGNNKCSPKLMEQLKKTTHFSRREIEALDRVYRKLITKNSINPNCGASGAVSKSPAASTTSGAVVAPPPNEGLERVVFRELIHNTFDLVTEEVLMDRIFCAFDRFNDGVIGLEEWVTGLSVFLRGTLEEKTAFCYQVYDLNNDGFITREEMLHLLRNCLVKHPQDEEPDEGVKDLVELAMRKLDYDKDGKVSYQDFQMTVNDEPLLLEAFGQCLPADSACQTFMSTL